MTLPIAIQTDGRGPDLLCIHGTAADRSSWRVLAELLRDRVRVTSYHRRGTPAWPLAEHEPLPSVADHAADAAAIIEQLGDRPVHVCAVSFGAVVTLQLMKQRPDLVRGAILFEPALSGDDGGCPVPQDLLATFEAYVQGGQPERAAEYFYRRALSDHVWNRLPKAAREDARRRWRHIRMDLLANAAYRLDYQSLRHVQAPVLLLQGGRSRPAFEPALRALAAVLPRAQRQRIERAEHLPSGDAWRELAVVLAGFIGATPVSISTPLSA